jgi:hypothetical protein
MSEITVTRALAELKTLHKRIQKLTTGTTFISTRVLGRAWRDHNEETKSNFQAVRALVDRYERIKFAIIRSNANVQVTIGGVTYTVAEAIARKESMQHQRDLYDQMRRQRTAATQAVEYHTTDVQRKLDGLLKQNFSGEKKVEESDIKTITEAFLRNNRIEEVDPLGLDKVISELDEEIQSFAKEVDFTLSESNATTKIVV